MAEPKTCTSGRMGWMVLLILLVVHFAGILLVATAFYYIESDDADMHNEDWIGYVLFCTTIVTTIGYGHIVPTTSGSKALMIFYALIGIPIFIVCTAQIGIRLNAVFVKVMNKILSGCQSYQGYKKQMVKGVGTVILAMIGIILFMFIPSIIFTLVEEWTYADSLYFTFITLTTIGFGDMIPGYAYYGKRTAGQSVYVAAVSLWILVGLTWVATLMTNIHGLFTQETEQLEDKMETTKHGESKHTNSAEMN